MIELKETLETRVSRLGNYLIRAYKHNKSSILFAMYLSEFLRSDVEKSLEKFLKEQGLKVVRVDAGKNKDIPSYVSSMNSNNTVFLVHNMEKGFPEAIQFLNFKREELVEHQVKAVFWVKEEELARISTEAPDFFAFRNRVVEFMEVPLAEERRFDLIRRPALIEFALETEYKSLDEIKRSIELKEKLLSKLSGEDKISEYLLGSLGILYHQIGSYKKSIECSEKAVKIAQKIDDREGEGMYLGNLGLAYYALGDAKKAIEYYEKALKIAQEIGDRQGEGARLGNLGLAYYALGDVRKAIEFYENALKIAQEIGDRRNESTWLESLSLAYRALGDAREALEFYVKAAKIELEIGDRLSEGTRLGDLSLAYNSLDKALKTAQEISDRRGESVRLGDLGDTYYYLGDVRKAIEHYEKALKIAQDIGDRRGEGICLGNLGVAYGDLGDVRKAIEYQEKALKIAQDIGNRRNESTCLGNLGLAYGDLGDVRKAIEYHKKALKIAQEIDDRQGEGTWLNNLGVVFKDEKRYKEALACYLLAKDIRTRISFTIIEDPYLKTTESKLAELKEELGEKEFEKLKAEVAPRAAEIVRKILEETSV